MPRHFTVDEANALLPTIIPRIEELRRLTNELPAISQELGAIPPAGRRNGQGNRALALETRAAALAERAQALLRDLLAAGVEVKDPSTGLIDFRSWRAGREVYLCWRLGEGDIAWWHDLDAGFRGRRPL